MRWVETSVTETVESCGIEPVHGAPDADAAREATWFTDLETGDRVVVRPSRSYEERTGDWEVFFVSSRFDGPVKFAIGEAGHFASKAGEVTALDRYQATRTNIVEWTRTLLGAPSLPLTPGPSAAT